MFNWVLIFIPMFLFLSSPVVAIDLSFTWNNNPQEQAAQPAVSGKKNNPPLHAPAYGNRSKRQYQYFPSSSVYHDAERGLYFYLRGAEWRIAASLPNEIRIHLGDFVSIEMDSDKPYIYNDQHKKRYPPVKEKKAKEEKGSKWANKKS